MENDYDELTETVSSGFFFLFFKRVPYEKQRRLGPRADTVSKMSNDFFDHENIGSIRNFCAAGIRRAVRKEFRGRHTYIQLNTKQLRRFR